MTKMISHLKKTESIEFMYVMCTLPDLKKKKKSQINTVIDLRNLSTTHFHAMCIRYYALLPLNNIINL